MRQGLGTLYAVITAVVVIRLRVEHSYQKKKDQSAFRATRIRATGRQNSERGIEDAKTEKQPIL